VLDALIRPFIDPPLRKIAAAACKLGISANGVTLLGLAAGIAAAVAIGSRSYSLGLALILVSRLLDGLDGAVARCTTPSDFGGYLDTICDYLFYVGIPLGFAFAEPDRNALAAATLVASFVMTCASFLTFAIIAAKRGLETSARGQKSFFYSGGLMEGTETIAFFVLMTLRPTWFPLLGWTFAALCVLTALQRTMAAREAFG
jgi:phosphatidylglycerophosphate synthase